MAAYRAALEEWTRDRVPLNWATTQNNLGTALRTLGERESGSARLEETLLAHESALDVYESARAAHYIAVCRANLNRTLALLSQKKNEV